MDFPDAVSWRSGVKVAEVVCQRGGCWEKNSSASGTVHLTVSPHALILFTVSLSAYLHCDSLVGESCDFIFNCTDYIKGTPISFWIKKVLIKYLIYSASSVCEFNSFTIHLIRIMRSTLREVPV